MMKLSGFPKFMFKGSISFFIIISFVIIIDNFGICQTEKLDISKEAQKKEELSKEATVNVVPYSNIGSEGHTSTVQKKYDRLSETVKGLKDAGYSLDEMVVILKNDKNEAHPVSIACLKQGYGAESIYVALIKAGFDKKTADTVINPGMRSNNTIKILNNNSQEAVIQKDTKTASTPAEVLEVPVSVGVTFNGLGSWGNFQDNRYQ